MFVLQSKPHWKTLKHQDDEFDIKTPSAFHYSALQRRLGDDLSMASATRSVGLAEALFEFSDDLTVYSSDEEPIQFKNRPKQHSGSLTLYATDDEQALEQHMAASPQDSPVLTHIEALAPILTHIEAVTPTVTASSVHEEVFLLELPLGEFEYSFDSASQGLAQEGQDVAPQATTTTVETVVVEPVVDTVVAPTIQLDSYRDSHRFNSVNHLQLEFAQLVLDTLHRPNSSAPSPIDALAIWAVIKASQRYCRRRRCCCRNENVEKMMKPLMSLGCKIAKPTARRPFQGPQQFKLACAA